ncbi:MAG: ATP-binding cassette domain-containing protein [Spirochaetes bacterium]|nr:ATP-binding cassette domain-containing protein [Spirochaetota bacterium]
MIQQPVLKLSNISYSRDTVPVLHNLNLEISKGCIHAIAGDHGAGKSCLSEILSGALRPQSGEITYNGITYTPGMNKEYKKQPVMLVGHESSLFESFSIAQNLLLPDMMYYFRPFYEKKNTALAKKYLDEYNCKLEPWELVKNISTSERQVVFILRILIRNPDIILLDSSFDYLNVTDTEYIKKILFSLRSQGKTIVYFTNRIDDIFSFAESVSILKKGTIIWSGQIADIDRINLIRMCYTEVMKDQNFMNSDQEFYELFKFNEAIIHNLPISIIVTDFDNRIRILNKSARTFFNLPDNENIMLPVENLFGDKSDEVWIQIKTIIDSEVVKEIYNIKINLKDEIRIVNVKTFPIHDGDQIIGHILLIQDITRQEALREQVILSENLASVGLLAAGVAHEINNPLEIVYNHISYLKYNIKNPSLLETLNELEEEMDSIRQIVSNLISFSGSQKIVEENVDMNELIEKLINLIKINAIHKKIDIKFYKKTEKIFLTANKNEIKQVLLNLIKNSIEAMPEGGEINIITEVKRFDNERLLQIFFEDAGPGIAENEINNIFLPFYSNKKRQGKNLGLGLSVSYGIIEKYGGRITVENIKGRGCRFIITFILDPVDSRVQ